MLLGEDCRRHQNGHLCPIHHGFEGRPNTDFGFAEAYITADEAIHRFRSFHVGFGFHDRSHLVGSFLKNKGALKFTLPRCIRREGMPLLRLAGGLDREQIAGHIAHGPFGVLLGFGPPSTAQGVKGRSSFACPDIFADEVGLSHWDIQFGRRLVQSARRVFNNQALLPGILIGRAHVSRFRSGPNGQHLEAQVPSDAVLQMHDVIPLF